MPKSKVHFFPDAAALRAWFAAHGATAGELQVGYHKRHTGRPSPTWSESVDEALCFGWIDGVRHRLDDDSYTNRFTPRRKGSHWSTVNVAKAEALIAAGRMTPAGLAAFDARSAKKTGRASYENRPHDLPPEHEQTFRRHRAAWAFFSAQPPGYRRTAIWYVVSAVRAETQRKRLRQVIDASAAGHRIVGPSAKTEPAPAAKAAKAAKAPKAAKAAKPAKPAKPAR